MSKRIISLFVVLCLGILALPAVSGAASLPDTGKIRPYVKAKVYTSKGIKEISLGGKTKPEVKKILKEKGFKTGPKSIKIASRNKISTLDLSKYKFLTADDVYGRLSVEASGTKDAVTKKVTYNTKNLATTNSFIPADTQTKIKGKVYKYADDKSGKTKSRKLYNGAKLSGYGGYVVAKKSNYDKVISSIMKYAKTKATKPATVTAKGSYSAPSISNNKGTTLVVIQSLFKVFVFKDNKRIASYPIAVGTSSFKTPSVQYRVARRVKNPTWHNPGAGWSRGMPSSMSGASSPLGKAAVYLNFMSGKDSLIRFHGTAARYSIGTRASHGCMRMYNEDVVKLYSKVKKGAKVFVYDN